MSSPPRTAVLLMAYGSPRSTADEDIRAYLDHILRFYRRVSPSEEEVRHLKARYEAVGGSPLHEITGRIVAGTQRALDAALPGAFRVFMGMKHSAPYVEAQVRRIGALGFERAVGVALAPFRSRLSTDGYYALVRGANAGLARPVAWSFAPDWNLHPLFLDLWQRLVVEALRGDGDAAVVFSNHSLPARVQEWNEPYREQFEATARAVAQRCGLGECVTAYQSAGGGNVPWLGPSLSHVLAELIGAGRRSIVVAPVGFVMDHLEVLYDLDVDARQMCAELGVHFARTRMPNDDPLLVAMVADVVRCAVRGEGGRRE
jgi:ferrochelatase